MADWKQITARIRRARTSKDPAAQLSNLFAKTRDAMVAFELARYFETSGNPTDAGRWYLTAAERFRRSDWKTKAQESATRLGATEAAEVPAPTTRERATKTASEDLDEPSAEDEKGAADAVADEAPAAETKDAEARPAARSGDARRRRGRRGGREHRTSREQTPASRGRSAASTESAPPREPVSSLRESSFSEETEEEAPSRPSGRISRSADATLPSLGGRSGDPGLSSRLSQMQMNFRRLVACDPVTHEVASSAPAGPGVWVLTDSDLSTYYYVEACQTLRVAIPNLFRNASVRRGDSIKAQLAEHLGISEARVSKYLADHCVVRWQQMDEGASHFAHFLVAVLQPALNE